MTQQDPAKILIAGAIGFALGVLFAPRSGHETRERLRHKSEEAQRRAKLVAEDVKQYAREGGRQIKEAAAGTRQRGKEMKDEIATDIKGEKG